MYGMQQVQRQLEWAAGISLIVTLVLVGLFVWAVIWSHLAFQRWEARENAKVKALQRIANGLNKASDGAGADLPEWAATR